MTPFEIDILLHYYGRAGDSDVVRRNPPIWLETRTRFIADGLLELLTDPPDEFGSTYRLTERGHAYCDGIQRVPLPRQRWVIDWPSGESCD